MSVRRKRCSELANTTVYSGLYTHPLMVYDLSWVERAKARQRRWCASLGAEYRLIRGMERWARLCHHPESWSFGTMIKFAAMEDYLGSGVAGDFVWVDLDVYPTDAAFGVPVPRGNLFYAPLVSVSWAREHDAWHMNNKLAWWNPGVSEYFAWSTGMYVMDRDTVEKVWGWLNRHSDINSRRWWDDHYVRQCVLSRERPWEFGTEEALLEEWLNSHQISFECMTDEFHSVHHDRKPVFLHFYGQSKKNYPL
mgnify:CR=1 FL=1